MLEREEGTRVWHRSACINNTPGPWPSANESALDRRAVSSVPKKGGGDEYEIHIHMPTICASAQTGISMQPIEPSIV